MFAYKNRVLCDFLGQMSSNLESDPNKPCSARRALLDGVKFVAICLQLTSGGPVELSVGLGKIREFCRLYDFVMLVT